MVSRQKRRKKTATKQRESATATFKSRSEYNQQSFHRKHQWCDTQCWRKPTLTFWKVVNCDRKIEINLTSILFWKVVKHLYDINSRFMLIRVSIVSPTFCKVILNDFLSPKMLNHLYGTEFSVWYLSLLTTSIFIYFRAPNDASWLALLSVEEGIGLASGFLVDISIGV